jgi:microcompartment protein CcmK/EutM
VKNKNLAGYSLVTLQKLNKSGNTLGDLIVAIDTIGCSVGEMVLVTSGENALLALENQKVPVDHVIVGIVDTCDFK